MIKGVMESPDGQRLVLGLSRENVTRLLDGKPIMVKLDDEALARLNPADLKAVVILGGETEADILNELNDNMKIRTVENE